MVRIRLQRLGRTHRPFYRVTAIDQRTRRNGRVLENLGWYDPMSKGQQVELKSDRIKEWLAKGAQPSETVMDMLAKAELLEGDMLKTWEAGREVSRKRVGCKQAIKTCEAAAAEIDKMDAGDADLTPFSNAAKKAINDAKRTVPNALLEHAEAAAASATKAVEDAKQAVATAKPPEPEASEEAPAEGEANAEA